jgi:hypothetical protein
MTRYFPVKRGTAFTSAARSYAGGTSGVYTSSEIVNPGYSRLVLRTMPAAEVGTATFDLKVQGYDAITAVWYDIAGASLAQISANRTTAIDLILGAGLTAVANRVVSTVIPKRMRVHVTLGASGTDGFTFGVEYELHP